jgi:hypothetical protein
MKYFVWLCLFITVPVTADDKPTLWIGGTQHSEDSDYTYLGAIRPLDGQSFEQGWYWQAIASWLSYEYDLSIGGQPDTLKARAPGVEVGLGHRWSSDDWNLALSLSAGYRDYRLSPDVRTEKPEGSTLSLIPQLQFNYAIAETVSLGLLSNWAIGPQSTFNRLRLGYQPNWRWQLGPELYYQEGRNYRVKQAGLFASRILDSGLNIELNAGLAETQDQSGSGYIGFALSKFY